MPSSSRVSRLSQVSGPSTINRSLSATVLIAAIGLAGCSNMATTAAGPSVSGAAIKGHVHGGQQPVSGSHVYLFQTGTSGYGSASTSILSTSAPGVSQDAFGNGYVTTDANGDFTITGDYTCPASTGNPQTYFYASGGNPGLPDPSTNNVAIQLIAALGPCSSLTAGTLADISEVSTAVAITALQQFYVDPLHIGTLSGNTAGLANAFASINDILDLASSTPRTTNIAGTGTVPVAMINSLGDILAPCVNSASSSSAECAALFADATPPNGTAPTSVAAAMLDIAKFPANNTSPLLDLINSAAPFQPFLAAPQASLTVGVTYKGGGLSSPGDINIDASGNAWVVNCPTCPTATNGTGSDSIVGFGPQGAILSGANGYTTGIHHPQSVAIDLAGNIWSTNQATGDSTPDNVMQMTAAGAAVTGFPFTSGIATPEQVVINANGDAWVSNFDDANLANSYATKISASGTPLVASVTSAGFSGALGLGIDNSNNLYMAGTSSNPNGSILKFDDTGTVLSGSGAGYTGGGIYNPISIAIDSTPHVWTYDNFSNAVSEIFGVGGAGISSSAGYTAGLFQAAVISIDGAGTVWIANCRASCAGSGDSTHPDDIVHLGPAGNIITGASGYQDSQFSSVGVTAIDASGNLWVTNNTGASVTELLGVAVPVDTPTAQQVKNMTVGLPAGTVVPPSAAKPAH